MIAVIEQGGHQYIVREGDVLEVEWIETAAQGSTLEIAPLMVGTEEGAAVKVGTPTVKGAKVVTTVVEHGRRDKVSVIKFKSKSRYRRNVGHHQPTTTLKIEKIVA
jgi:large subunit ribosomal protein L21